MSKDNDIESKCSSIIMKLLYLSNALIPSRQANSIHIMKICSAFSKIGFKVSLTFRKNTQDNLYTDDNEIFEFYGIKSTFKLISLQKNNSLFSIYFNALISLLICMYQRPKIIISRFLIAGFLSSLFFNTLIELHQLPSKKSRLQKYILKFCKYAPKFKGLIVITNPLKELFISEGFPRNKIYVLPDGADPAHSDMEKILFKANSSKINIGYAGHLFKGRGIELLYEIADSCPWTTIHIAGGNDRDIKYHQKNINQRNISNIKMYGFIKPNEVANFFAKMDILVAPYQKKVHLQSGNITTEKWMSPLKVFEYMAAAKPIICSEIDVLKEVLKNRENCILCDPENVNEWIDAIELLRDNQDLANLIISNALKDLNTKYSWKKRAETISDIILKKTIKLND